MKVPVWKQFLERLKIARINDLSVSSAPLEVARQDCPRDSRLITTWFWQEGSKKSMLHHSF